GQMGRRLVCRLGSGVPRDRTDTGRRGLRQAAVGLDGARAVPASERSTARVRMELRRCQSTGARLVHYLYLSPGANTSRQGRRGVARACLAQVAVDLHLVGESQVSLWEKRVRRLVSGAG